MLLPADAAAAHARCRALAGEGERRAEGVRGRLDPLHGVLLGAARRSGGHRRVRARRPRSDGLRLGVVEPALGGLRADVEASEERGHRCPRRAERALWTPPEVRARRCARRTLEHLGRAMGAPEVIVRTHQHHAIAGESLSGCVYVVAKAPVDIDGLTLHFNGVQQVHVYYQERGATGNSRSQTASSTTRLAGHGCRLHEGGTLAAGTHGFPFEVPLGRGLPASVQRGIMYHLNATLKMRGLLTPDVTKERNVTLLPPCVPAAVLPVDFDPDFKKVDFFCCVSRGHVALAAAVDDAQFDRGDTVEVCVCVQTDIAASSASSIFNSGVVAERHREA